MWFNPVAYAYAEMRWIAVVQGGTLAMAVHWNGTARTLSETRAAVGYLMRDTGAATLIRAAGSRSGMRLPSRLQPVSGAACRDPFGP